MFGKNRGELVLAKEHGQVCGVPAELVGEPQDIEAGDLSLGGFVQAELRACCICI